MAPTRSAGPVIRTAGRVVVMDQPWPAQAGTGRKTLVTVDEPARFLDPVDGQSNGTLGRIPTRERNQAILRRGVLADGTRRGICPRSRQSVRVRKDPLV
jgi:hypothetical protein